MPWRRRESAALLLSRRLFGAALLLAAAGCATVQPPAPGLAGSEELAGRMALRVEAEGNAPARSLTAAFELRGNADAGRLDLTTPLGSVLAQARWSPREVVLATPRGERTFPDLDALTREVLGESLPVAALFDWLRGRPWAGAPSTAGAGGFEQLGWNVDLAQFDNALVSARRETPPPVSVRIKLDR
jgi:outer membrane lipoprotein LolB